MGGEEEEGEGKEKERVHEHLLKEAAMEREGAIYSAHSPPQTSILSLLSGDSALLREQLCRFFNTFSSLSLGRSYLAHCPPAIRTLCSVMMKEERDTLARRNALGAIQKLSLR